jgi:hypothetical protein
MLHDSEADTKAIHDDPIAQLTLFAGTGWETQDRVNVVDEADVATLSEKLFYIHCFVAPFRSAQK